MEYLFCIVIGIVAGWFFRETYAKMVVRRIILNTIRQTTAPPQDPDRIPVIVEKHDGIYIVYNGINNEFMAQGKDYTEVTARLVERYPGKLFMAIEESTDIFNKMMQE